MSNIEKSIFVGFIIFHLTLFIFLFRSHISYLIQTFLGLLNVLRVAAIDTHICPQCVTAKLSWLRFWVASSIQHYSNSSLAFHLAAWYLYDTISQLFVLMSQCHRTEGNEWTVWQRIEREKRRNGSKNVLSAHICEKWKINGAKTQHKHTHTCSIFKSNIFIRSKRLNTYPPNGKPKLLVSLFPNACQYFFLSTRHMQTLIDTWKWNVQWIERETWRK